jgi:hypothetical protein
MLAGGLTPKRLSESWSLACEALTRVGCKRRAVTRRICALESKPGVSYLQYQLSWIITVTYVR